MSNPLDLSMITVNSSGDLGTLTVTDTGMSNTIGQFTTIAAGKIGTNPSGRLVLKGPDADIDIDGISLKDTLLGIQQRLALLQPNLELEAEWHQLQELGEQYRTLEAELLKKQRTWNTIKQ